MKRILFFAVLAVLTAITPVMGQDLKLELGFDVASGDYGTTETLTAVSIPLTVGWHNDRLDLALTIPWISQSKGTTVLMGGRRFGSDNPTSTIGTMGRRRVGASESSSGLGDINLDAAFLLLQPAAGPELSLLGYLKAPTGDDTEGLGTGAWDAGGGLELYQPVDDWFADLSLRYILPGDNGTYQPDAYWDWSAVVGRYLNDSWQISLGLDGATAPFDGEEDALELIGALDWDFADYGAGCYLLTGLSDGSPDFGGGAYIALRF